MALGQQALGFEQLARDRPPARICSPIHISSSSTVVSDTAPTLSPERLVDQSSKLVDQYAPSVEGPVLRRGCEMGVSDNCELRPPMPASRARMARSAREPGRKRRESAPAAALNRGFAGGRHSRPERGQRSLDARLAPSAAGRRARFLASPFAAPWLDARSTGCPGCWAFTPWPRARTATSARRSTTRSARGRVFALGLTPRRVRHQRLIFFLQPRRTPRRRRVPRGRRLLELRAPRLQRVLCRSSPPGRRCSTTPSRSPSRRSSCRTTSADVLVGAAPPAGRHLRRIVVDRRAGAVNMRGIEESAGVNVVLAADRLRHPAAAGRARAVPGLLPARC